MCEFIAHIPSLILTITKGNISLNDIKSNFVWHFLCLQYIEVQSVESDKKISLYTDIYVYKMQVLYYIFLAKYLIAFKLHGSFSNDEN